MNDKMLPLILFALANRNGESNGKELAEALLFSSNAIPEGPRAVLSIKTTRDRAQAQEQQDDITAREIATAFDGKLSAKVEEDDLTRFPSLAKLVNRLPADDKLKIINPKTKLSRAIPDSDGNSQPSEPTALNQSRRNPAKITS